MNCHCVIIISYQLKKEKGEENKSIVEFLVDHRALQNYIYTCKRITCKIAAITVRKTKGALKKRINAY